MSEDKRKLKIINLNLTIPILSIKTIKNNNSQQRGPPLSPAQQRRRAAEERISNWTPKTELGRRKLLMVKLLLSKMH